MNDKELELKIVQMLQEFKIHPEHSGFDYLVQAIIEALKGREKYPVAMSIYSKVADKFKTTSSRVERCIRYAIENSKLSNFPNRAVIYKIAIMVKYDK